MCEYCHSLSSSPKFDPPYGFRRTTSLDGSLLILKLRKDFSRFQTMKAWVLARKGTPKVIFACNKIYPSSSPAHEQKTLYYGPRKSLNVIFSGTSSNGALTICQNCLLSDSYTMKQFEENHWETRYKIFECCWSEKKVADCSNVNIGFLIGYPIIRRMSPTLAVT